MCSLISLTIGCRMRTNNKTNSGQVIANEDPTKWANNVYFHFDQMIKQNQTTGHIT